MWKEADHIALEQRRLEAERIAVEQRRLKLDRLVCIGQVLVGAMGLAGVSVGAYCGGTGNCHRSPPATALIQPTQATVSSPTTTVDFPADPPVPLPVLRPLRPPTPLSSPSPPSPSINTSQVPFPFQTNVPSVLATLQSPSIALEGTSQNQPVVPSSVTILPPSIQPVPLSVPLPVSTPSTTTTTTTGTDVPMDQPVLLPPGQQVPNMSAPMPTLRPLPPPTARPQLVPLPTARPQPVPIPINRPVPPPATQPQPVPIPIHRPVLPPPTARPQPAPITLLTRIPTATTSSRADAITNYINSITLSGQTLHYPSSATAEERALQWLIDDDSAITESNQLALRQRYALSAMRFQTRGSANAAFETWTSGSNECNWFSIFCNPAGKVITLNLYDKGVQGRIPKDLGLLSDLSYLDLYNNGLTGPVPSTLRSLTALSVLNSSRNALTGTIPSSLSSWTDLTIVYMYTNGLTGTAPFCSSNLELSFLIVDCSEVNCPCCTHCCPTPEVGVPVYC